MAVFHFDRRAYSLEAAQAAAYRFIDRLTVVVSTTETEVLCDIEPNPGSKLDPESVLSDFKRELLDQQLRIRIKHETEPVRNLILSLAFSQSGLQS